MKKFIVCAAALACSAAAGLSMAATPAKVMVLLSPGFEEGETVEILDVVRRGGFEVDAVSIAGEYVPGSHNIVLKADRVLSMEMKDLKPGMELTGTVRNVIDFGAFVDIGVHQDGLVHISRMADRFIRHPSEVVRVGDVVTVWVVDVDVKKQRIALSMVKGRA